MYAVKGKTLYGTLTHSLAVGIVKERRLHFAMRGKNIHFQHGGFNITHFFGELQRAKYFDSILARLSIEDLEKITMQFEDQIKDIVIGEKYDC